ncbi:MAG TPA: hypothetical protein VK387_00910 [Thermoleophilaceae bacterium]|nr:hypothetical protein [Thermoleophilaceae bacterium]
MASEQVVRALALAEAHNHVVEPTLEQADLAAVVYRDGDIEVPLLEPLDRITEGDERLADRACDKHGCEQADHPRGDAQHEDAHRHSLERRALGKDMSPEGAETEQRHSRGKRPGEHQPALDAGSTQARRGSVGERAGGDRPHQPLGEQVGQRGRDEAAQDDRRADVEGDLAREAKVDRDEKQRADPP